MGPVAGPDVPAKTGPATPTEIRTPDAAAVTQKPLRNRPARQLERAVIANPRCLRKSPIPVVGRQSSASDRPSPEARSRRFPAPERPARRPQCGRRGLRELGSACVRIHACMAIAAAAPALIERVEPNWAMAGPRRRPAAPPSDRPGPPGRTAARTARHRVRLQRHRAGQVVDAQHRAAPLAGPRRSRSASGWWTHVQVPVGDHRAAAVPPPAADDVDRGGVERVRGPDHRPMLKSCAQFSTATWNGAAGGRGRRRSPRRSSTGSGRRRCGGRRRAAAPGRSAGRPATGPPTGRPRRSCPGCWPRRRAARSRAPP